MGTVGTAISAVLTYAVGVALSPLPLIAVILVLFSTRSRVNGPAFLVAWAGGLGALITLVVVVGGRLGVGDGGTTDDGIVWLRVLVGAALLVAAVATWRQRPDAGAKPSLPPWLARIEGFSPRQALGMGLILSWNPKNIALAVAAGLSLAQLGVPVGETATAIAVFVVVGSAAVIASVGYSWVGGARSRRRLDEAKAWLELHNGALVAALYLVFGALLVSSGLDGRS